MKDQNVIDDEPQGIKWNRALDYSVVFEVL
jgi:hypothetical protein